MSYNKDGIKTYEGYVDKNDGWIWAKRYYLNGVVSHYEEKNGITISYNEDGSKKYEIYMDEYGNKTEKGVNHYANGTVWYERYQDKDGNILWEKLYKNNNILIKETIYQNGVIQTITNYYDNGKMAGKWKYKNGIQDKLYLECDEFGRCENVFKEEFYNNNANSWWNFTNNNDFVSQIVITNQSTNAKALSMNVLTNNLQTWQVTTHIPLTLTENFSIETTLQYKGAFTNHIHGIIWGFKDWNNYYSFLISANGSYIIWGQEDGINTTIKQWTSSSFINQNNAKNTLKILRVGNSISFAINGNIVYTDTFRNCRGNNVGFGVKGIGETLFEKLIVKQDLPNSTNQQSTQNVSDTKYKTHTVGNGETLCGISRQYGVSINDIISANPSVKEGLTIGQKLYIPTK